MHRKRLTLCTAVALAAVFSLGTLTACGDDDSASGSSGTSGKLDSGVGQGEGGAKTDASTGPGADGGSTDSGSTQIDPKAGLPPGTSVDLGLGDCNSTVTKTFDFTNTGGKDLDVTVATTSPFNIAPSSVKVVSGGKGSVTLSVAVPASATAGAKISGTVTINTNDPTNPKVTIPVTVTPQGATLVFDGTPTKADFGTTKLNVKATDIAVKVKNTGNKSAAFTFTSPADNQFTIAASPASPATLAANGGATVTASFTPTALTLANSTTNITATGTVCGTSLTKIDLSGQGTTSNVTGWPTSAIDFGAGTCGAAAGATQKFTLSNSGTSDVTITSVGASTKGYTFSIATGAKVPAGGTLDVVVTPPAIPSPSAVPGSYGDSVAFTTDVTGDTTHNVAFTLAAQGAILAFDTTATANFGAFGLVPVGNQASETFSVVNSGTVGADVTVSTASPFGVTLPSFNVGAGNSVIVDATFKPTTAGPASGTVSIGATGVCQPLPAALPLTGTGAQGGISISDSSLLFTPFCGEPAGAKTFTVKNTGNAAMTWAAVLGQVAVPRYVIAPHGGTAQPGEVFVVTVTPATVPGPASSPDITMGAWHDDLTITTDITGDTAHNVALDQHVLGAVLSVSTHNITFPSTPVTDPSTSSSPIAFTITNHGNSGSNAGVTLSVDNNTHFFLSPDGSIATAPNGTITTNVTFNPLTNFLTTESGTITLATSDHLCAPLPTTIAVSGHGTQGTVSVGANNFDFGATNCGQLAGNAGTPAAAARTVSFSQTATGNQDYTLTAALGNTVNPAYDVAVSNGGVVRPNGGVCNGSGCNTVTITVTPHPVPQTLTLPHSYNDTLTVTTSALGDLPHTFSILQSAQGVIIKPITLHTWNFGSIPVGIVGSFSQSIFNLGNHAATASFVTSDPHFGGFLNSPIAVGSNVVVGHFTPDTNASSWSDDSTITIDPGDSTFCQPLPDLSIALLGAAGLPVVTASPSNVNLPSVACDAPANAPFNITLTNNGNVSVNWTATPNDPSLAYTFVPLMGSLNANSTGTITVTPKPFPSGPSASSGAYNASLAILANGQTNNVTITQTATGADLFVSPLDGSAVSSTVFSQDGGATPTASTSPAFLSFQNTGNGSISVTNTVRLASNGNTALEWGYTPLNPFNLAGNTIVLQSFAYNIAYTDAACPQEDDPGEATLYNVQPTFTGAICHRPETVLANGSNVYSFEASAVVLTGYCRRIPAPPIEP